LLVRKDQRSGWTATLMAKTRAVNKNFA